ncbi:MAG: hypothetical protein RLZZ516_934 [Cyanobacteriota bacterium]|jgi:hypothetical protein
MPLTANGAGQITGSFTIPANVPVGAKRVTFLGNQGSFGAARFIGEGTIITQMQRQLTTIETRYYDPLAQTFRLDAGRHVTGVDFKFTAKGSSSNKVFLEIRETELGLPNATTLAEGVLQGSAITVGAWNKISLTRPVYLQAGVEYAMVLLTDDAVHAVALAELGKYDSAAGQFVTSQPYTIGTLLKSSNATTWTPVQEADLSFRMYGATFTSTTRTVSLGQLRAASVSSITRSGTTATVTTATAHGFSTGQKVVISGATQTDYNGAFTVTVSSTTQFTYTVANSPATPATGTILAAAGDITDLVALAGVERVSSATDAEFIFTKPDGTQIRGADNARIQLAEDVNVPLTMSAVLRGTTTESPYLFAGTQAVYGNLGETGTYVTRAVPCAASAKVSVTFESLISGGAGVTVEIQKSDSTWQTVTQTSSSAVGDGWTEQVFTVASFTAGGSTTRARITLSGTAAARPQVRQLRMVVI